jgi:maleate isomerase
MLNATDVITAEITQKLGIIAAPGWFDPTQKEFATLCPEGVDSTQTILPPSGFDYSFSQMEQLEPHLETAARLLADAGSQLIGQVGPAFAYFSGGTPEGARALQQRLSQACNVPVILHGVAVLDALAAFGSQRIALACPYYDAQWKARILEFLAPLELSIESCETFVEQGIFSSQADVDARHYQFSESEIKESIRRTRASAPEAELVFVAGAGVRFLNIIEELELELGIPVLSADVALYWALLNALNIKIDNKKLGTLLRM